jgi:ubiquinone/menaquinone biosynthesis C-methylase UbiE
LIELVRTQAKLQLPFDKGISVGGGTGQKEMNLLRQGIVNEIEVYEYSEARIALGKKIAKEQSLEDRISFIHGDAFEIVPQNERYDFVHWNNSLHHMLDVDKAVECHYLLACINIIGLLSTSASL